MCLGQIPVKNETVGSWLVKQLKALYSWTEDQIQKSGNSKDWKSLFSSTTKFESAVRVDNSEKNETQEDEEIIGSRDKEAINQLLE